MLGCLVQWAVELSKFDIQYRTRPAIKSQVLADFVVGCTLPDEDYEVEQEEIPSDESTSNIQPWILYVDRSTTLSESGARIILISLNNATIEYALRFAFSASNNEAEYEALIIGL